LAARALLKVTRENVQKSSGNSAIGACVANGLVVITLLVAAGYAWVIASANVKALDRLRPLELRFLEIVFRHGALKMPIDPSSATAGFSGRAPGRADNPRSRAVDLLFCLGTGDGPPFAAAHG
jgi:hypothetical protein